MASGCSEHNYETPKLLQKSPRIGGMASSPPQVNRKSKPNSVKTPRSDQEDGYEPVGKAAITMETWIAEKNNEFNAIIVSDADSRNIHRKLEDKDTINSVPPSEVDTTVSKSTDFDGVELFHLQRNLSDKSIKSDSSSKTSQTHLKEIEKLKSEEEKNMKLQQKKERIAKENAEKDEKRRQKEEKKCLEKAKLEKKKKEKRLKEEEKEGKKKKKKKKKKK